MASRNQRPCPALGGTISAAECGSRRGSELDCPGTCPHFPFGPAGYDLLRAVEDRWMFKVMARGRAAFDPQPLENLFQQFDQERASEILAGNAQELLLERVLHDLRDHAGRSLAEGWAAGGWQGLNNDERLFMEARLQAVATVIEVQRVRGGLEVDCVDLLAPVPREFTVVDRGLAATATPYARLFGWLWHTRGVSRVGGAAVVLEPEVWRRWRARLQERLAAEHEAGRSATAHEFMAARFEECSRWGYELTRAVHAELLSSLQIHQCVASYALTVPMAEVVAVLAPLPDFEQVDPEPAAGFRTPEVFFHWLRRGESRRLEDQMPVEFRHAEGDELTGSVGNLRLYADRLSIETFGKQKHAFARKRIEALLGKSVRFENERFEDVGKQVREQRAREEEFHDAVAEAGGPTARPEVPITSVAGEAIPREVQEQALTAVFRSHYQKFLDDRIPALQGMTPRQAAQDPAMRPRLVELMKDHVHQMANMEREKGLPIRIDWVLEELRLTELL